LGLDLGEDQWERLEHYAAWLASEAVAAGVVGPQEVDRLEERHLADALSFGYPFRETPPKRLLDVGSGAGLPGIPLAILFPGTGVTLLDRSRRRATLLRRAKRLLDLANVEVVRGELAEMQGWEAVTMRAVLPPTQAVERLGECLASGGRAVLGLARRAEPDPSWETLPGEVVQVPVLDPPGWLLIMTDRGA
jgi:16S rRNA (guanine(527)-N(7))-methyltransferase RsmG